MVIKVAVVLFVIGLGFRYVSASNWRRINWLMRPFHGCGDCADMMSVTG